jgi:tetratricopeptide (TPR) repeat protein
MVQNILDQAMAAHGAGDRARAEALYRQVLANWPNHPDALHLLGRLAIDGGNPQAAIALIGEAVRQRPRIAEYQAGLAEAQRALGQAAAAAETYRRAVRLKPQSPDLHMGHGLALAATGQDEQAMQALRRAMSRDPARAAPIAALGGLLLARGDNAGAAGLFRAALRLAPDDGMAHFNFGCALLAQRDFAAAETAFRAALARLPAHMPSMGNLARVLQDTGRLEEAAAMLQTAVAIAPDAAPAWLNLGLVRRALSEFAAAETAFRRAAALSPTAAMLACVGNALRDQGRLTESETVFRQALATDAQDAEARLGLGLTRLLAGNLAAGWPDFAWRAAAADMRARVSAATPAPVWHGQALAGALLIYAEQGAGDFCQMARFIPRAAARAQGVVLCVPAALRRLARTVAGVDKIITMGEPSGPCAAICADLDLPAIFAATLADAAMAEPYLAADATETKSFRDRLDKIPGRKIGLAWSGNPAYFHDPQRSIAAAGLEALAGAPDIAFVSLQPGAAPPPALAALDFTAELTDFAATAALICALDLVISVDTAVAHLAGALGRPVWLLNRYAPDWRWLLGRADSPWYPTLRQFRQETPGDWAGVLRRVREAASAAF